MASRAGKGRLRISTAGTSEVSRCAARAGGTPRPRRDTRISADAAGRAGFTLLEALVALAISALVLVALYGAVVRAAGVRERAARSAERVTKARMVLLRMAGEVEGAL